MPKIRKLKRSKKFKANINRKRLRNKMRKLPDISCKDIKTAWENTKSTRQNLGDMGLAYDANESLKIPNSKREILDRVARQQKIHDDASESDSEETPKHVITKGHVALNLEAEAKAPRERMFRLPNQQVQFVTYLMDKYADDYKSMARDKKNYYQMTWRQIRSKINTFKGIPEQYAEYLLKNGDIVLDDSTTMEETRRKIAEENVKKYCAPKPKKQKPVKPQESDDDMDFDNGDKLEDLNVTDIAESNDKNGEPEKKLQLFSDDDDDDSEDESSKRKPKVQSKPDKNRKTTKLTVENKVQTKKSKDIVDKSVKKAKLVETRASSDSDSNEELEEDNNDDDTQFVDLNELSDEELSDDDVLDDGEFVTDSDESD